MRTVNEQSRRAKQIDIMEKCFDCYAENGLAGVGVKAISEACGCNVASLYQYFENLDDIIIQSTEYCMSKVEDEFMAKAPTDVEDLWRFIDEIPYWTAEKHGKKFFAGVDKRYTEYAKSLEPKLGIPYEKLTPLIFILVRACVHYALFEDEFYLKSQIALLKEALELFIAKYNPESVTKEEKNEKTVIEHPDDPGPVPEPVARYGAGDGPGGTVSRSHPR